MDTSNLLLDDKMDKATKKILENVIKRKKKFDKYKKRHTLAIWGTLIPAFLYINYLYFTIAKVYSYSFAAMFSAFVKDSSNLIFLFVTIGMYGWMNLMKEKMDKAEKEFHELRCEIVERSKDLWGTEEEWKNRHVVFDLMNKNFEINLYHQKK